MLKQFIASALFAVGLSASAQGVYQFNDPGFENWKSTNVPGNGWNSFESAEKNGNFGLYETGKKTSPKPEQETTAPHSGSKSLKIWSKNLTFANANGNITTGVIMMGSSKPVDDYKGSRKNHNKTMRSKAGGYMLFDGTPDKISFYAKFKSGGSQNGSGRFILHGDVDYRDPDKQSNGEYFPDMKENLIGEATILVPATTNWTYFESDFTYYQSKPTKQYLLASLTTNPNPGESSGDELYVDDIQFIYYHGLSSLSYNNEKLTGFSEDKLNYDLSTEEYDETKVAYEIHGKGASVEKVYNKKTGVLTINVKGNDYAANNSSITTYTIQFKHEIAKETVYKNSLLVDARKVESGIQFTASSPISVLHYESNNCYDLLLKDFSFGGLNVGDILVEELTPSTSEDGTLTLTANAKPTSVTLYGEPTMLPITVDAQISKAGNMTATITIDMGEGATVDVTFAPQLTISPLTSLEVSNATGLTNVVMNRTFAAGWNTYCMPFDYNLSSLSAEAKAQEFVSSNGYSLTFNAVNDNVLKANVPYLVYFPTETKVGTTEEPLYFVTNVASYQPTSVEYNGFTFVGNYEASKSMDGLYGVASEGDVQKIMLGTAGSTLPATCAYFTTKNMNANGLRICFDGGEVTGINQVNGAQAQSAGAVYNLQGIKVSNHGTNNLPAGLYIMQGKKVIVK